MQNKKIAIVGAGPSGMMAAIRAAQLNQQVTLFEKNPLPGKKLLLSGKGRCNITNALSLDLFLKRFSKNGEFLRDAFKKFFNQDLIDFFKERGLELKTERQLRVFPVTDSSESILEVLKKELLRNKVQVIYGTRIQDIIVEGGKVKGVLIYGGSPIVFDAVIMATGGVSYAFTGSDGEGLRIIKDKGHKIIVLRPGLVALKIKANFSKFLEGLTLKNISLKFNSGKKEITTEVGEMVFTAEGISGPLVLSLSGKVIDWLLEKKEVYVTINLKPGLTLEQLDNRFLREFKASPKKGIRNIMKGVLPVKLGELIIGIAGVNPDKKANQITLKERSSLANILNGWRLNITGSGPIRDGMVTRGGVSLKEINPRTMESKLIKGLYFCGEMIDVDADTGGFNLQAAFSTGYLAGESAVVS
ncbi:MAG: NAD(P)/FAD-dependent oxidoreductase [Candidatus Omnitrophica bacterium]|nr:NAD(P)/FAD-dependent oxidoreductase [Candidatus Omnitrophota bacterium]